MYEEVHAVDFLAHLFGKSQRICLTLDVSYGSINRRSPNLLLHLTEELLQAALARARHRQSFDFPFMQIENRTQVQDISQELRRPVNAPALLKIIQILHQEDAHKLFAHPFHNGSRFGARPAALQHLDRAVNHQRQHTGRRPRIDDGDAVGRHFLRCHLRHPRCTTQRLRDVNGKHFVAITGELLIKAHEFTRSRLAGSGRRLDPLQMLIERLQREAVLILIRQVSAHIDLERNGVN